MNKNLQIQHANAYFMKKEEHYPQSDRFVHVYQQTSCSASSYIRHAFLKGQMICKKQAEPNQKWHFTKAWYAEKASQNPQFGEKELTAWCGIRCPELLLWMAEAAGLDGVEKVVDDILDDETTYGKNDREARRAMVSLIKAKLSWGQIADEIEKLRNSENEK